MLSPSRPNREPIQVFGSAMGKDELEAIRDCLERQWIGAGSVTAQLERELASHLGVPDFVLLDSGSNSLQMAVHVLDLPPGSEIILPSFTWVGCANAVLLCGHRPVFCDVDETTQNLDLGTVERVRTERSAAVMAVHYAGLPAPVDALRTLGLPIIEDAAHAIDSRSGTRACGTRGDVGIFSFDAIKNLSMGEGGGLVALDPERARRARDLRHCGIPESGQEASRTRERWWEHEILEAFPRMLPSDVHAAIGLAQLHRLPELQRRRAEIWRYYREGTRDLDWIHGPADPEDGDQHSYFTYLVRVDGGRRDALAKHLLERNIYTTLRFHPLHLSSVYACPASLPATESLMRNALNLPLHPRLRDADLDRVIEALRGFEG